MMLDAKTALIGGSIIQACGGLKTSSRSLPTQKLRQTSEALIAFHGVWEATNATNHDLNLCYRHCLLSWRNLIWKISICLGNRKQKERYIYVTICFPRFTFSEANQTRWRNKRPLDILAPAHPLLSILGSKSIKLYQIHLIMHPLELAFR